MYGVDEGIHENNHMAFYIFEELVERGAHLGEILCPIIFTIAFVYICLVFCTEELIPFGVIFLVHRVECRQNHLMEVCQWPIIYWFGYLRAYGDLTYNY